MDEFSYLSVLLSIILGLAVTQILQGFRGLMLSRTRVQLYWPTLVWALLLLVVFVQTWWAMFSLRNQQDWTFAGFAIVLLHITSLYMLAGLVLPNFHRDEAIDLREHYYAHHGWFFVIAVVSTLASIGKDLILNGSLPNPTNLTFHLVFIAVALGGALLRREWYHKIAAASMVVLFGFYIVTLFEHLR
ncbi:MAG: hypothetical protein M3128_04455 [Verrucomicrobiota bacterium]|nr:hypothetical protein [Verrucomicrobiota bacterium]